MPTPARSRRTTASPRDRITTQNVNYPRGAGGTTIDRAKYDAVKRAILSVVPRTANGVAFKDLAALVKAALPGGTLPGGGSINWYVATVKLDLEARGLIGRIPDSRPQRLRRP